MAPDSLFLDVPFAPEPHRLTYYRWGNPKAAQTVICVHGLTRNGRDFDFLAEALAEHYQVIAPDMPGRGESDWLATPALYNYQTYLFDLQCLVYALELPNVHWVGTSMGGILGMMMSGAMPGLLTSLVLNDVGCVVAKQGLKRILSYAGIKMHFASRAEAEAALKNVCAPFGITEEKHWQHLFAHSLYETEDGKAHLAYDPAIATGVAVADPSLVQDVNLWPLWETVKPIPTLLIRGETSDILTRETALEMKNTHPRLTLHEIKGAGHAPALMDAAQITTIKEWLLSPPNGGIRSDEN